MKISNNLTMLILVILIMMMIKLSILILKTDYYILRNQARYWKVRSKGKGIRGRLASLGSEGGYCNL